MLTSELTGNEKPWPTLCRLLGLEGQRERDPIDWKRMIRGNGWAGCTRAGGGGTEGFQPAAGPSELGRPLVVMTKGTVGVAERYKWRD